MRAICAILFLAGCGGKDDTAPAGGADTDVPATGTTTGTATGTATATATGAGTVNAQDAQSGSNNLFGGLFDLGAAGLGAAGSAGLGAMAVGGLVAAGAVAVGVVALAGCATAASGGSESLTTIGLGSPLGFEGNPGQLGADGQVAVDADRVDSVVVIGDSITKGSTPALREQFAALGFDTVLIEAANGRIGSEPGVAKRSKPPFGVLGHRMAGKGSIPAVRIVWRQ